MTRASKAGSLRPARTGTTLKHTNHKDDHTLLEELFIDELRDIYGAEKYLLKALAKMKKAATSEELSVAFDQHIQVTEVQIARIEKVFDLMNLTARARRCEGIEGLVSEAQDIIDDIPKGTAARDAGLIIAAQKIEHYEIAAYGSLVQLARTMGQPEVAGLLLQTLEEEKEADQLLTELAISGINLSAEHEVEKG